MIYNMYSTPDKQQSIIPNEPEAEKVSGIVEKAPEAESEKPKKTTKKKG